MIKESRIANRKSKIGFNLATAVLAIVLIFAASLIKSFIGYTQSLEQSQSVLRQISSIILLLERAESGFRGYLYTDDARFLSRYHIATNTVDLEINKLEEMMDETTYQAEALKNLRQTIKERYKEYDELIKESQKINKKSIYDKFKPGGMRDIRNILEGLQQEETQNLVIEKEKSDLRLRSGIALLCVGLLISLGLMFYSRMVLIRTANEAFEQNSLLNSIMKNFTEGLVFVNANRDIIFSNDNLEKMLKFNMKGLNLDNRAQFFHCYHPVTGQIIQQKDLPIDKALQGTNVTDMEVILKTHNSAEKILMSVTSAPIYGPRHEIVGAIAVYRDITKKKQIEQELEKAQQLALEASRLKSEFLNEMGHEIRTPMNGVIGVANLLLDSQLSKEQITFAKNIQVSARYLLNMIQSVLDHALYEKGELRLEMAPFKILDMIEQSISMMEPLARERDVQLTLETDVHADMVVLSDATRIQELLIENLELSIRKTTKGFVALKVNVLEKYDDKVRLYFEIKDSGKVSDEESQQNQLKQLLHQEIIKLLDGQVSTDSQPGYGSRRSMTVDLVLKKDSAPKNISLMKPNQIQSGKPVLVAEDQSINQVVIKKYLERFGLDCQIVTDGEAAYQEAITGKYSMVLMDCKMQPLDGYESTKKIREHEINTGLRIPVVALTADGTPEDRKRCLMVGMDDYLIKPIDIPKLEEVLLKWVQPLIKSEFIKKLDGYQMEGKPLLNVLAADYFKSAPELILKIKNSIEIKDIKQLQYFSHTLKSASITLGLAEISSYCEKLEKMTKLPLSTDSIMSQIQDSYKRSESVLRMRLED